MDIAKGTIHSVGNLLKESSSNNVDPEVKNALDSHINKGNKSNNESFINNDNSFSILQNPISCNKKSLFLNNNYNLLTD